MRAGIIIRQRRNRYRAFKWGRKKSISILAESIFYVAVIILCAVVAYNLKVIICNNSIITEVAGKKLSSEDIKSLVITDEMKMVCSKIVLMSEEVNKEQLDNLYEDYDKEIFWFTVLVRSGDSYPGLKNMDGDALIKTVNMCCRSGEFKRTYDLLKKAID